MTGLSLDTRPLDLLVLAALRAVDGLDVYDGGVVDENGDEVTPAVDSNGVLVPYVVFYAMGGTARPEALAGAATTLQWSCQVTCVGAHPDACRWAVRGVRQALSGQTLAAWAGRLTEPPGSNPPMRPERDVKPTRWTAYVEFQTLAVI